MARTHVWTPDTDHCPTLTYSINSEADAAKFSIDATTGALSFVSISDYENPADADRNTFPTRRSSDLDGTNIDSQAIAVSVSNVNDNAPIISSNGGGATAAITIAEN